MYNENIQKLLEEMKKEKIDFYFVPTGDFHNSEYSSEFFKVREFLSGFTGSNGSLVISEKECGLWTDGRYFIQAEEELKGSGITLFRMLEKGVPTVAEYLEQNMKSGDVLGFDGRVVDSKNGMEFEEIVKSKKGKVIYKKDLVEKIWKTREELPAKDVFLLEEKFSGKSFKHKLDELLEKMKEEKAEELFISKLDDIMWLLNIRGMDVECNPVALSFFHITKSKRILFIQKKALNDSIKEYLKENNIEVKEYSHVYEYIEKLKEREDKILLDLRYTSFLIYRLFMKCRKVSDCINPTELLKAKKNPIELKNMIETYKKDSVALTKFIYWIKTGQHKDLNELSAAHKLYDLREKVEDYICPSFPTICAYRENAAKMHYEATETNYKKIDSNGMLLVDSGGQYYGGTTDVTRTIAMGKLNKETLSQEEVDHYTLVASGMLNLSDAVFLSGCSGRNLDILARNKLWKKGIDYKCGTGHGIGFCLNVHEGPQNIRWKYSGNMVETPLEPGMIISNEPGVYLQNRYGIRIENILYVDELITNSDGTFLNFKTLTYVPLDPDLVNRSLLSDEEVSLYNSYQKEVLDTLAPYLEEDELEWLKSETRSL